MFTGIIFDVGEVVRVEPRGSALSIIVLSEKIAPLCKLGDSVAINGCCLTVERITGLKLSFTAGSETLANTTLSKLSSGQRINLEPALTLNDRLGGHIVLGHVDYVAKIEYINIASTGAYHYKVSLPENYSKYISPKGSIAIDGVSLTMHNYSFNPLILEFFIIPQTYKTTIFKNYSIGSLVNFEVDHFAKLIWHMLDSQDFNKRNI